MRITKEDGREIGSLLRLLRTHVKSVVECHSPACGDDDADIIREAKEDLARIRRMMRALQEVEAL